MCGRFTLHSSVDHITQLFEIALGRTRLAPRYNIAPSQEVAIVVREEGRNLLGMCHWGFLPSWAKDRSEAYKMINARAETVAEKPSFRKAFREHRCLVVADGFFEWKKEGALKRPVYVRLVGGGAFGFAGLYNHWTAPDGNQLCTTTIITTEANDLLRPVHDRMPVITTPQAAQRWLDPAAKDRDALLGLLKPYPSSGMELFEVSPRVNSPKNDSPENIRPLPDASA